MPGFDLAQVCAREFEAKAHAGTVGMVLMNHGVFSFGATARESYERMISLVSRAEAFLDSRGAWDCRLIPTAPARPGSVQDNDRVGSRELALRREVSAIAGGPMIMTTYNRREFAAFAGRSDIADLSRRGPPRPITLSGPSVCRC